MATSWGKTEIVVAVILAVLVSFFLYQIISVLIKRNKKGGEIDQALINAPYTEELKSQYVPQRVPPEEAVYDQQYPDVPGQTEEEMKAPEPLQRPVQQTELDAPQIMPSNISAQEPSKAMFEDNLRHPEASFRKSADYSGSFNDTVAPAVDAKNVTDVAQNSGEFMQGIMAFDQDDVHGFSSF